MNLLKDVADVGELRAALAAAEDDRDRAQDLAEERLRVIEELRGEIRRLRREDR